MYVWCPLPMRFFFASMDWSHDITHDTLDDITLDNSVKLLESGDTQNYSNKSEVTSSEIAAIKQVSPNQTWLEVGWTVFVEGILHPGV